MSLKDFLLKRTVRAQISPMMSGHFADVQRWKDIYHGGGDWRYTRRGGINGGTRRVAALNAAKAVCAELSRLCCPEVGTGAGTASGLCCSDKDTERFVGEVLDANGFAERFPGFLESLFALGGGAIKVYYDGGVKLDFVSAENFIPTEWNGTGITGGAFASEIIRDGKRYILAETQRLTPEGCETENRLFREDGKEEALGSIFPDLREKSLISGLSRPLFVYFRVGSPGELHVLGSSVFAHAEDTLKDLDIVFDSLGREFVLGKKRIIVPYYAVRGEWDENGDIKRYFDVNDEVFQAMSTGDSDELKITDNTADLRVEEHTKALAQLLDLLCMQTGLSEGALSFKDGSIRTAAEVVSRNSRTYRTQAFYRMLIGQGLAKVAENICRLGKMAGELPDGASESVSAVFTDGAAEDDSARADRAVKLYSAGIISRARAVSQIYGVSLEEARAIEREDFYDRGDKHGDA